MYFHKTPFWLEALYPQLIWQKKEEKNCIFLTFDDGPIPIVTEFVLEVLKSYHAKATFFCVGENIQKHSWLCTKILEEGHSLGNHTHSHLNGWKINDNKYMNDIAKCEALLDQHLGCDRARLFRPPYGRIKRSQITKLKGYQIIMWNVLTGDFDDRISPDISFNRFFKYVKPGSIIVFHDSLKAKDNLYYLLPKFMESVQEKNYTFEAL